MTPYTISLSHPIWQGPSGPPIESVTVRDVTDTGGRITASITTNNIESDVVLWNSGGGTQEESVKARIKELAAEGKITL